MRDFFKRLIQCPPQITPTPLEEAQALAMLATTNLHESKWPDHMAYCAGLARIANEARDAFEGR